MATGAASEPAEDALVLGDLFGDEWDRLVRLATLVIGRRAVAEEIVSEVFVQLLARPRDLERPSAYLRTAVINRCRSHWRRSWRERPQDGAAEGMVWPSTEAVELWELLGRLPGRQRAAVVLRYWEDLTIDEVAAALGCPSGTAASLLHRATRRLRKEMES